MSAPNEPEDRLSPTDMRRWLSEEIADLTKALQLRFNEASAFVNAYAAGEISAEEAEKRLERYNSRWGEPLPGATASTGLTDQEILAAVDNAAQRDLRTFQRRFSTRRISEPRDSSR
jgi:hypothetical protein